MVFLNIFVVAYDGDIRPMYDGKLKNYIEIYNEITISLVTMHLFCYFDVVVAKKDQYNICGWSQIFLMCQNIVLNMLVVAYFTIHQIGLVWMKYWPLFKV